MEYPSYRKLIVVALAAAIPVELVALAGLRSIPIDVGYAPGTPYWIQALGLFGLLMHYPVFRANIPLQLFRDGLLGIIRSRLFDCPSRPCTACRIHTMTPLPTTAVTAGTL